MAISRQKEARSRDYALLLFQMTSRVLYSAQYHRQHCTLHAFEQFGTLYMHNHYDKNPSRPGFEPGTPRLQDPVDTNEPSGPAIVSNDYSINASSAKHEHSHFNLLYQQLKSVVENEISSYINMIKICNAWSQIKQKNMSIFHAFEVVCRCIKIQLQGGEFEISSLSGKRVHFQKNNSCMI